MYSIKKRETAWFDFLSDKRDLERSLGFVNFDSFFVCWVESSHRCPLLSVTLEIIHCCTFLCYWLKLLVTSILFWYLSRYYHSIRKLGFQQSNLPRRGCISSPSVISKNSTYPYSRQPFIRLLLSGHLNSSGMWFEKQIPKRHLLYWNEIGLWAHNTILGPFWALWIAHFGSDLLYTAIIMSMGIFASILNEDIQWYELWRLKGKWL